MKKLIVFFCVIYSTIFVCACKSMGETVFPFGLHGDEENVDVVIDVLEGNLSIRPTDIKINDVNNSIGILYDLKKRGKYIEQYGYPLDAISITFKEDGTYTLLMEYILSNNTIDDIYAVLDIYQELEKEYGVPIEKKTIINDSVEKQLGLDMYKSPYKFAKIINFLKNNNLDSLSDYIIWDSKSIDYANLSIAKYGNDDYTIIFYICVNNESIKERTNE